MYYLLFIILINIYYSIVHIFRVNEKKKLFKVFLK